MQFLRKVAESIRLALPGILAAIRLWTPRQNRNDGRQLNNDDDKQDISHLPTPPDDPTELLERLQGKR